MDPGSTANPREGLEQQPLVRFFSEIIRVKGDARVVVLVAHGILELFVNTLVDHHCKNGKRITSDSRGYPHSARLIILNEIGVISDGQFKLYDWFRRLRNRAAHEPLFAVTEQDLAQLPEEYRTPDKLFDVCIDMVGGLWNAHIPVLSPRFAPGIGPKTEPAPNG